MTINVTNLVKNGAVATNTNGWSQLTAGDSIARVSSPGRDGRGSLRVNMSGLASSGVRYSSVAVVGGQWYSARMWVYAAPSSSAVGKKLFIRLRNVSLNAQATAGMTLLPGWQPYTLFYQPTTSGSLVLDLVDNTGQGVFTVYVTEAQVEHGYVPHAYVHTDGATATAVVSDNVIWDGKAAINNSNWFGGDPQTNFDGRIGASFVTSPVRRGGNALRFHNDADWYEAGHTNRIHLDLGLSELIIQEGDEYWLQFSLYLPDDYNYVGNENAGGGTWSIFADLPHPPVGIAINGSVVKLDCSRSPIAIIVECQGGDDVAHPNPASLNLEQFYLCDFVRNKWMDFLFHMKWTSDGTPGSSPGFIEAWVNRKYWQYGKHQRPLLFKSNPVGIIHAAHYHSQSAPGQSTPYASTTYQDEWKIGNIPDASFLPNKVRLFNMPRKTLTLELP